MRQSQFLIGGVFILLALVLVRMSIRRSGMSHQEYAAYAIALTYLLWWFSRPHAPLALEAFASMEDVHQLAYLPGMATSRILNGLQYVIVSTKNEGAEDGPEEEIKEQVVLSNEGVFSDNPVPPEKLPEIKKRFQNAQWLLQILKDVDAPAYEAFMKTWAPPKQPVAETKANAEPTAPRVPQTFSPTI